MPKTIIIPCYSKDPSTGAVTLTGGYDLTNDAQLTPAEVQTALTNPCPTFDTERETVCYTVDGGATILQNGELVKVYQIDPDTGEPDLINVTVQLYDNAGVALDLADPDVAIATCLAAPDSEVREVCVNVYDPADPAVVIGTTPKLLHIIYGVDGAGTVTIGSTFFTDPDGTNQTTGEVVVPCPEIELGEAIIACEP